MGMIAEADGSITYKTPLRVTALTLNGVDLLDKEPIEWRVWPNGRGYVSTLVEIHTGHRKTQVDGMQRVYTAWGDIVVALP